MLGSQQLRLQTTGQALLIKWADAQGKKAYEVVRLNAALEEYLPSTAVFWTEVRTCCTPSSSQPELDSACRW